MNFANAKIRKDSATAQKTLTARNATAEKRLQVMLTAGNNVTAEKRLQEMQTVHNEIQTANNHRTAKKTLQEMQSVHANELAQLYKKFNDERSRANDKKSRANDKRTRANVERSRANDLQAKKDSLLPESEPVLGNPDISIKKKKKKKTNEQRRHSSVIEHMVWEQKRNKGDGVENRTIARTLCEYFYIYHQKRLASKPGLNGFSFPTS